MIDPTLALQTQAPQSPLVPLTQLSNLQGQQQIQQQRGIQMQGDQTENQMKSLTLAGQQQSAQDQADYRAATAAATDPQTGQVDRGTLLSTLGRLNPAAAVQTASTLATQDTAAQEAKAKLQKAQTDAITAHLDLKDKLLQGVSDQATYTNARNIAIQNGINPQEMPAQYDPQFVAQAHAQTLSQQQQLTNQQKANEDAEAVRKDKATEANTAATQANTAAYRKAQLGLEGGRLAQENKGTLSVAQVPDGKGGMKSVLLNNKTGAITDTDPGLVKPSATQPPAGQPTTADRNRASLAKIALDNIDGIQEILQRRGDLFGPGAGRVSNVDQLIGSNDPDLVAVTNFAHNFSMANAGVHGSRSVMNVRDAVKDLLGDLHNGPAGIQGGLNANRKNLQSIINPGAPPPGTNTPTAHPFFQQFGGASQ
jgi:hypothetical protein